MKLLMPLLAALLATNLAAQSLDTNPNLVNPGLSISSTVDSVDDVAPAEQKPSAMDDEYKVAAGEVLNVPAPGVLANDGGESLLAMLPEPSVDTKHGTLELMKDGGFTYQPLDGFAGEDVFTYQAMDIYGNVVTAQIHFYCGEASVDTLVLAGAPPISGDGAEEAASCSAARGSAPWLLLPLIGLAALRFRRVRA